MANTYQSTSAIDVVGIFLQSDYSQVFEKARSIKASVNLNSSVPAHPLEDGSSISDHKIIVPIEIQLSCIIASDDYRSVYESIRTIFTDSTMLTVQTRSAVYSNMIISAMPHDETPDIYGGLSVAIKLQEVKFASYATGTFVKSPANPVNSDSVDGGKKQATSATGADKKQSILASWAS